MTSLDDIRETMAFLDDWESRYRFVIDLGRELPDYPDEYRVDANLVRGCQSQVWMTVTNHDVQHMTFALDSDAHIVRGLIAIVLAAVQGRTAAEIRATDLLATFEELDLLQHLSPTRGNGLRAMIQRVHAAADEAVAC